MRYLTWSILILIIFSSCSSKKDSQPLPFEAFLPDSSKTHKSNNLVSELRERGKRMNKSPIDSGVKGMEIRIWTYGLHNYNSLVRFKKSEIATFATFYNYSYNNHEDERIIDWMNIKDFNEAFLDPLVDSLDSFDFKQLISQDEIPDVQKHRDSIYYHMEIATPGFYKLLYFPCPGHFSKKTAVDQQFYDLILMLNKYLNFYSGNCSLPDFNYDL